MVPRLVVVHAHPDDECMTTGGTLAHYAAEGARVVLVTCTNGELGEIAALPGLPSEDELRPRLGEVRARELRNACDVLGVDDVRMLGYHDSGMAGTPSNEAPEAFVRVGLEEVASRIAAVIDDVRPHAVVTYDSSGLYGHPDHIHAHRATALACARASWRVPRLYYAVASRENMRTAAALLGDPAGTIFTEDNIDHVATADERITVRLDVRAQLARKRAALEAHRTQWGTTKDFLTLPGAVAEVFLGHEFFELDAARSASAPERGADLFEGLRD